MYDKTVDCTNCRNVRGKWGVGVAVQVRRDEVLIQWECCVQESLRQHLLYHCVPPPPKKKKVTDFW
jgi:hypothetical protein